MSETCGHGDDSRPLPVGWHCLGASSWVETFSQLCAESPLSSSPCTIMYIQEGYCSASIRGKQLPLAHVARVVACVQHTIMYHLIKLHFTKRRDLPKCNALVHELYRAYNDSLFYRILAWPKFFARAQTASIKRDLTIDTLYFTQDGKPREWASDPEWLDRIGRHVVLGFQNSSACWVALLG